MTNTMVLDCGTNIPRESFSRIFGGGRKKAMDEAVQVRFGDDFIDFKRGDLTHLQATLDVLYREYSEMRIKLGIDEKPRVRIKAGSVRVGFGIVAKTEVWRKIPGIDPWFEVSSLGNFRNLKKGTAIKVRSVNSVPSVSASRTSRLGYRQPVILNAAKTVAWCFCTFAEGSAFLHFRDGSRFNLEASNLEWIKHDDHRRRGCDFTTSRREREDRGAWGVAA